jgi:RNA polymerase sigma factor (sigma-70 family)
MLAMTESRMHPGAYVELLYEEYQRPVLAYLTRLVSDREAAEDLCQETFIKAMRGWEGRDPTASVAAWVYRIATNTAYDYLRRRRRIRFRLRRPRSFPAPLPRLIRRLRSSRLLRHHLYPTTTPATRPETPPTTRRIHSASPRIRGAAPPSLTRTPRPDLGRWSEER